MRSETIRRRVRQSSLLGGVPRVEDLDDDDSGPPFARYPLIEERSVGASRAAMPIAIFEERTSPAGGSGGGGGFSRSAPRITFRH